MRRILMICLLLVPLGCDRGPAMGTVTGKVTFDGKGVGEGTIQFFPLQPGPMAASRLAQDGSFELTTLKSGDGARVGEYTVVVVPPSDVNRLQRELKPGQPWSAKFENIPADVRSELTSSLTAKVESGSNTFTFDLKELSTGS